MRLDSRTLIIAIAIAGVGVLGYLLGVEQRAAPAPAAPPQAAAPTAPTAPAATPALPAAHPAVPPAAGATPTASGRYTHFRVGDRNVKRIFADGDHVWVGTSGGVIRYNLGSDEYRLFDLRSGLLATGIFHVGRIKGRIAVGTYGGGFGLFDAATETWSIYNIPQGLADAFVYDTLELPNGDVWVATWSGANRIRGGALDDRASWDLFTVENTGGGLPNDWVYGLAAGRDGTVWMATEGGLAHFENGRWRHWKHEDGLGADYELVREQIQFKNDPAQFSSHHARQKTEMGLEDVDVAYNPNYIIALLVDREGIVWCGTWGGGLARFDGKTWTNYTMADGLPGNHVFMVHEDPEGRLWIGTSNGLARRDGDGFRVYTTADGLYANIVFSMATAKDGSAWIGSYGGVAHVAGLE